jgi:type II secretory pathway pseudopilin PulG
MSGRPGDTRGQSITLSYTLGLAISLVLVTGLLIAGGNFVQNQQREAARSELRVVGQQIAADMATADRLVQSADDDDSSVTLKRTMTDTVAGSTYSVQLAESKNPRLVLTTTDLDVNVTVGVANETNVTGTTIGGGEILVNETSSGQLTLESVSDGS